VTWVPRRIRTRGLATREAAVDELNDALQRVARGDLTAVAPVYDILGPAVYALSRRVLHEERLADQATVAVFVEMAQLAPAVEGPGPDRAWVAAVARRVIAAHVRLAAS